MKYFITFCFINILFFSFVFSAKAQVNVDLIYSETKSFFNVGEITTDEVKLIALAETNSISESISGSAEKSTYLFKSNATASEINVPEFSWGGYFKAIGSLFLILGCLWIFVFILRRKGKFVGGLKFRDVLAVESRISLGHKKGLVLVRFLNSQLLLGVTEQQITLLKEVEWQDAKVDKSGSEEFSQTMQVECQKINDDQK